MLILPGSKRVVDDLEWLRAKNFEPTLRSKETNIIAICGGYEMMFENILDPYGIESEMKEVKGFGRFKGAVIFEKEKVLKKGTYNILGTITQGYEIHNAKAKKNAKKATNLYGTFVHGIFESDALRLKVFQNINKHYQGYDFNNFKRNSIEEFANHIENCVDIEYILKNINNII